MPGFWWHRGGTSQRLNDKKCHLFSEQWRKISVSSIGLSLVFRLFLILQVFFRHRWRCERNNEITVWPSLNDSEAIYINPFLPTAILNFNVAIWGLIINQTKILRLHFPPTLSTHPSHHPFLYSSTPIPVHPPFQRDQTLVTWLLLCWAHGVGIQGFPLLIRHLQSVGSNPTVCTVSTSCICSLPVD